MRNILIIMMTKSERRLSEVEIEGGEEWSYREPLYEQLFSNKNPIKSQNSLWFHLFCSEDQDTIGHRLGSSFVKSIVVCVLHWLDCSFIHLSSIPFVLEIIDLQWILWTCRWSWPPTTERRQRWLVFQQPRVLKEGVIGDAQIPGWRRRTVIILIGRLLWLQYCVIISNSLHYTTATYTLSVSNKRYKDGWMDPLFFSALSNNIL